MFNFIESGKHILCVNGDLSVVLCLKNMVLDIKFARFENTPWGFRLTGGNDFELPLTVIKVSSCGCGYIQLNTKRNPVPILSNVIRCIA